MMRLFISIHNDDEVLYGAYSLLREKPLVLIVTDSWIQPLRGDVGCSAEERRQETINAMAILKCPVAFLGIKDTELTEELLTERLKPFVGNWEEVYAPAIQGGNPQHDIVGRVAQKLFTNVRYYTTYTKTELWTKGEREVIPTEEEKVLKTRALNCYKSQIMLPSTRPHFLAVIGKSEWLI
jgi:LmbE family N-acetylglucosaminyl deacetylase